MPRFPRHKYVIIQSLSDLPEIPCRIERLFLDTETTSYDRAEDSLNPWHHCWISGVAFTWDENPTCYYLPIGHFDQHTEEKNLPEPNILTYVQALFDASDQWINHNLKYDSHVLYLAGIDTHKIDLFDTLPQAKLIESDRWTYAEDALAKDWLQLAGHDEYKQRFLPWIDGNKDWGRVPIRLMGPYACDDVWKNRELFFYIKHNMPQDVEPVSATECKVTQCLVRAEQFGLDVDVDELKKAKFLCLAEQDILMKMIQDEHGILIRPNTNTDCHEIFYYKYGLPVMGVTEKGAPSYDKFALAALRKVPGAPIDLIDKVLRFRHLISLGGTFIEAYLNLNVHGVLHPSFNQSVRTGRMSCKQPNAQQLNKPAKQLIRPRAGYHFLDFDYKSIEFRLIAMYLGQPEIIQKFADDPDADFHQIVADMCHIERQPAKSVNFAIAFGGGKKKVLSMLASNATLIADIEAPNQDMFIYLCEQRANKVFSDYHKMLYRLKPLTRTAASRLAANGFVRNIAGRHRHLPTKASYRAFNTVIQSSAADLLKDAVVRTSPIFNDKLHAWGIEQAAFVHDSIVFAVPNELRGSPEVYQEITRQMINTPFNLTVPMRVSCEVYEANWGDCTEEISNDLLYGADSLNGVLT